MSHSIAVLLMLVASPAAAWGRIPTIEKAALSSSTVESRGKLTVTLRWTGGPAKLSAKAFVFIMDERDYEFWPATPSDRWAKEYSESLSIELHDNVGPGHHFVCAGLYDADGNGRRLRENMGAGVHKCPFDRNDAFQVGELDVIRKSALAPPEPQADLLKSGRDFLLKKANIDCGAVVYSIVTGSITTEQKAWTTKILDFDLIEPGEGCLDDRECEQRLKGVRAKRVGELESMASDERFRRWAGREIVSALERELKCIGEPAGEPCKTLLESKPSSRQLLIIKFGIFQEDDSAECD